MMNISQGPMPFISGQRLHRAGQPRFDQVLADIDSEVTRSKVAETLGCPPDARPSPRVVRQIDEAITELADRADVRVESRTFPVRVEHGRIHVAGGTTFRSGKLSTALQPCRWIHVFVMTLGGDVDRFINEAMQDRPNFGVVVDAAASQAMEAMVDRLEEAFAEQLSPHAALSLPFSPGHCDWPVTEQQKIFSLLPDRPAGVVLSDDLMMTPRKSVSGVFGAGPVEAVTEFRNPCVACARADCAHRRCAYRRDS